MRYSKYFIPTLKETPADADTVSAKLMLRAGMIRKLAAGIYDWLPLGYRALRKVEAIVREEMDRAGALEVWLPHVQPKDVWEESGRWTYYGKELLRFKDRKEGEFCFAPTAEEVITDLARRDIRSYRDLPVLFYQFGTKFRDEIRPRFGIMRAREFYMKDAYSFHASDKDMDEMYQRMVAAYTAIFSRLGLKFRPVEADTGAIGGSFSHEFMVLADTGEEQIAVCDACGYAANIERAEAALANHKSGDSLKPMEEIHTPNLFRVQEVADYLKVTADKVIKTVFMVADGKPVVALVRGDTELNEHKLQRLLGAVQLRPASEAEYREASDSEVGFAGPTNIKARMVADHLIGSIVNAVSGAGKKDFHLKNINPGRDFKLDVVGDIRNVKPGDPCVKCKAPLRFVRGIEVGHVFKLGTKYSQALKAHFLDETGQSRPLIMGCYGIGVSRIVAAAIEQNNDDAGIRWPVPIAPFEVVVTPTNMSDPKSQEVGEKIYNDLTAQGIDVLYDDRDTRAGIKFKDADLIGIPYRVTIGEKSLAKGVVEIKARTAASAEEVPVAQAAEKVRQIVIPARLQK